MREKLLMNQGWRYFFGEPEYKQPKYTSSDQQYRGSRAENARGPGRRDFLDADWRTITVPHDFVAENGLSTTHPFGGEHFDFPQDRGSAWYRRYFRLDNKDKGRRIRLHFESVATRCEVYVNSMLLKTNHTAGIGFDVDITDVARFDTDYNVVAVHADCHDYEAWYYEGGGICRNVWLVKTDLLSVALWGTYVKSKRVEGECWQVQVETEVENRYNETKTAHVVSRIMDLLGNSVACLRSDPRDMALRTSTSVHQYVELNSPMLWDLDACHLYTLLTEIVLDGEVVDRCETRFGIREVLFDADKGMFLNGRSTTIYGFANHQLYLGVGDAMSDSMREFQIRTLKEMGGNGFRTAHSPHGEATYDYCDQYGLLVMDENRVFHSSDIVIDEMQRMIKRDRNHPSIIMWALYNEEDTVTHETGKRIWRTLAEMGRQIDDTRPMTGAASYGMFTEGAFEDYDLVGINHETMYFDSLHSIHPTKPLFCSEMIFPLGDPVHGVSGLDARVCEKEYMIGGFHFTAWNYGPNPSFLIDCTGTFGPGAHGFRAYLRQKEPFAKICPDWNFPGKEGQSVHLYLANNGDFVDVFVNGKALRTVQTDMYAITPLDVVYEPGTIEIVAFKDGKEWARDVSFTPGTPAAIQLKMENLSLKADDTDVAMVTAFLVDEQGRMINSETGMEVVFSANESGEFISTLSARDDGFQGYNGPAVKFFQGKCQAFFRSLRSGKDLVISAETRSLPKAELVISRSDEERVALVPTVPCNLVLDWTISKLHPYVMDDQKLMREHMLERWEHIDTQGSPDVLYGALPDHWAGIAGMYPPGTSLNFACHAYAMVPDMGDKGGKKLGLHFEGIDGPANIYVTNGEKTAFGHHPANSPWPGHYRPEMTMLCDEFKPGDSVEIWVFIHDTNRVTGIGWPVRWTFATQEEIDRTDEKTKREWAAGKQQSVTDKQA